MERYNYSAAWIETGDGDMRPIYSHPKIWVVLNSVQLALNSVAHALKRVQRMGSSAGIIT